jgi:hypothetical protein
VPIVLKSVSLNLLEPSRPVQTCNGIALPFTRFVWVVEVTPQLFCPWERNSVPVELEDGWAPGLFWAVADNLAPAMGFQPLVVPPVTSRCTYCAIPAHNEGLLQAGAEVEQLWVCSENHNSCCGVLHKY